MSVDMNAVRAARREALGEGPKVIIGDQEFSCPPDMPFDALVAGQAAEGGNIAQTYEFVRELMGADGLKALKEWRPSLEEMSELVSGILAEYGQGGASKNGDSPDEGEGEGGSGEASG